MLTKHILRIAFLTASLSIVTNLKSQLSGTFSVPGTYTSIAAVINDLNTQGINGPVTINISAGYTETAPVNGYTLTATGTSLNPIVFQKSGIGSNPLITAYSGGNATPSSTFQDGIWRMFGCDYVTIDGIDLFDGNTTNPSTMEFGYGFYKTSPTNGCQYNIIKNCTISLNRINNTINNNLLKDDGSRCIEILGTDGNFNTILATSFSGTNSYNKIYANTVQNCNAGIVIYGISTATTLPDEGNDIGGNSVNTGNRIINYGGTVGSTRPAWGIFTEYQKNSNISFNEINNNNGSGFDHPHEIFGIYTRPIENGTNTINSNTITVKNNAVSLTSNAAISIGNGSVFDFCNFLSVSNNIIKNCSFASGDLYGITNQYYAKLLNVNNNIITKNTSSSPNGTFYGINLASSGLKLNINNNLIDSVTFTSLGVPGNFYGIKTDSDTTSSVFSILSNTLTTVLEPTSGSIGLYLIFNQGYGDSAIIKNNLLTNISCTSTSSGINALCTRGGFNYTSVTSNTVTNFNASQSTPYWDQTFIPTSSLIFSKNLISNINTTAGMGGITLNTSMAAKTIISSNTITALTFNNTASSLGGSVLYTTNLKGPSEINNNIITNLTANSNGTMTIFSFLGNNDPGLTIKSNTISIVTHSHTVKGINLYGSVGVNILNNKISDLESNGYNQGCYGIEIEQASGDINIQNNVVGDLRALNVVTEDKIIGINLINPQVGAFYKLFYNSVFLNPVSSGTNFGSFCLYHEISTLNSNRILLKNNVLVNLTVPNGWGKSIAFARNNVNNFSPANYDSTSNNNLFYAGTPGPNNYVFGAVTNGFQTMAALKPIIYPREISSVSELPPFISTIGSNNNFLNINPAVPTQIEMGAIPITGITSDFVGNLRNTVFPDIGAWEGNYTPLDLLPPVISNLGYTNLNCNTSTRSFTVNIKDVSGVANGSLSPKCYYKVNSGSYLNTQGTLISGTPQNGVWSFNLTYTASSLDLLSYFIVAQDIASPINIASLPSTGFSAADVNTITTPPTSLNSYKVGGTLNGTYIVGSTGTFTTLTDAAYAYNNWCITGPVTFLLNNPYYATTTGETFPIVFRSNVYASPTNSLLIRPNTGVTVLIAGPTNGATVLKFLDAKYIKLDGINTPFTTTLMLSNLNTGSSSAIWFASSNNINSGCKRIEIANVQIEGSSNTNTNQYGIVSSFDGSIPNGNAGADNDSIIIMNNTISKVFHGIRATGTSSISAGGNDNWVISNNTIGPVLAGPNNIGGNGIIIQNAQNFTIMGNLIQNIFATSNSATYSGINLYKGINAFAVIQNTINNVSSSVLTIANSAISGIRLEEVKNIDILKNNIYSIYNSSATGYGARGVILYNNTTASNIKLENNMISDIYSFSSPTPNYWPIGISVEGNSGGVNIDNNSIYLEGSHPGNNTTGSACIYFNTSGTNINLRNNILSNTYDNTSTTNDYAYSIYSASPSSIFSSIDYNDYFVSGATNVPILGYISSSNQNNLTAIQSSFGNNLNSKNIGPTFVSNVNLHLIPANNISLDNLGSPVSSILTDIDNQVRNTLTPDIGADEYTAPACSSANAGTLSVSSFNLCDGQNVVLNSIGGAIGVGTQLQWMVSLTSGGPYTNVLGGTGSTSATYTSSTLSSGVYYYTLQNTCITSSLTGVSNEATVTVNPNPTVSVVSSSNLICLGSSATLTSSGATFYNIQPGSITINPCVISPTTTTNYTITGVNLTGCAKQIIYTQNVSACTYVDSLLAMNHSLLLPNPTTGILTIINKNFGKNIKIEIYDCLGKKVKTFQLGEVEDTINIEDLVSGLYFYILISKENEIIKKDKLIKH